VGKILACLRHNDHHLRVRQLHWSRLHGWQALEMKYTKTTPCSNCPFLKNGKGITLDPARVIEIDISLERADFPCHKTDDYDEDDNLIASDTKDQEYCAGALIMLEKMNRPSQMMRICERLGLYDRTKLNMDAPVFKDFKAMLAYNKKHPNNR
jgi:hypothetical protein